MVRSGNEEKHMKRQLDKWNNEDGKARMLITLSLIHLRQNYI